LIDCRSLRFDASAWAGLDAFRCAKKRRSTSLPEIAVMMKQEDFFLGFILGIFEGP